MEPNYSPIKTEALIALARLILRRAKLSLPNNTREQAIGIIRGIRPAPPRRSKINVKPVYDMCCVCYKPMVTGTPVDSLGRRHAHCELKGEHHAEV